MRNSETREGSRMDDLPVVCQCGKPRGDHRLGDCPVGKKTRIGYLHYGPGVFRAAEKLSPNLVFWKRHRPSGHWHLVDYRGKLLGHLRRDRPNVWDAYVSTGKKWPEGDQIVNFHARDKRLGAAKYALVRRVTQQPEETSCLIL